MSITLFGLIWLIIVAIAFIMNSKENMLFMLILGMVFQSASVFLLDGNGVGAQLTTSFIFILWTLVYSNTIMNAKYIKKKYSRARKCSTFFLILLAAWIIIIICLNNQVLKKSSIEFYIMQLLIYMICFLSIWTVSKKYSVESVNNIMLKVISVVVFMGIVQLLVTTNILPRNVILEMFVYTSDTDSAYYLNLYYPRIFSVFMEPSYCGAFLVGAFYYLISLEKLTRYSLGLSMALVLEIMLTFSSTAYGAFFLTGIVYLLISKNKKAIKYLIPLGAFMILLLVVMGQFQDILDSVILNKASTGSAFTRGKWDENALKAFLRNPVTGAGYKVVRGSHLYTSLAGQLGIVGLFLYMMMIAPLLYSSLKIKFANSGAMFLIGVIIAQLIAIPDLDFCVFWQGMYVVALFLNTPECIRQNDT